MRTERAGSREWFSDKLFVEAVDGHRRPSFSLSAAIHVGGAIVALATVVAQTVHMPAVHAHSGLVMPAMVSEMPSLRMAPEGGRTAGARPAAIPSPAAAAPQAAEEPAPVEAPSAIEPETAPETGGNGDAAPIGGTGSGVDAVASAGGAGAGGPGGGGDETAVRGPYRIGRDSGIKPPRKIKDVKPAFPMRALVERAHGSVIIEATIGEDGRVTQATLVHSVPTLDAAALDAVRQWEYTPSMLNGVAVPVVMLVVVAFTIQ